MFDRRRFLKNNQCFFMTLHARKNQKIFLHVTDYRYCLRLLRKYKNKVQVNIFAFCLLPEEIHLVIQSLSNQNLSMFTEEVSRDYKFYFESRYQIHENIFSGRHKKVAILNDMRLMDYIKFIEFMPVKFQMADTPAQYPWSSYSYRVIGDGDGILDKAPCGQTFFSEHSSRE